MHLLRRVARVDALARRALGRGELAEAGEAHRLAALQRLGDRVEERVDRLAGVTRATGRSCPPPRSTKSCFVTFLSSCRCQYTSAAADPNSPPRFGSTMRFCGSFLRLEQVCAPERGRADAPRGARARPLRPPRGRPRRRPLRHSRPASRSASTAASAAPPDVTTSSTRQTRSPGSKAPSMRLSVPYPLAALRTMRNGRPDASEADAASATAPSSGAGEPVASGSRLAHRSASARRAARAAPAASRSGTCRGTSASAGPSAARSRPRAARARASARARSSASHARTAASASRARASSASRVGGPAVERQRRAVVVARARRARASAAACAGARRRRRRRSPPPAATTLRRVIGLRCAPSRGAGSAASSEREAARARS